jgi:hypothetical protein
MKRENLTMEQLEMVNGGFDLFQIFVDKIKEKVDVTLDDIVPKLVTNPIVIWVNDKL